MIVNKKIISLSHISLVIAFAIVPFTLLRFYFFGLAELILIILFFFSLRNRLTKKIVKQSVFFKFWIFYICISLLGFFYNFVILGHQTGNLLGMFFDLASYFFVLISCFYLERSIIQNKVNAYKLLYDGYFALSILLCTLYIFSFFSENLFGLPLKYYGSFSPLVANVHQITMVLVTLPFIGIYLLTKQQGITAKFINIILIGATLIMSLDTSATKATMAIYVGGIVYSFFYFLQLFGRKNTPSISVLMILPILILILNFDFISYVESFFVDNDGGGARAFLYSKALAVGINSPLIGLGPGGHVNLAGEFYDTHQTHLTVFLQTGLIGLFSYVFLMYQTYRNINYSPALIACFSTILIYSLGGDVLRRLPLWIILVLIYYSNSYRKTT